MMYVAIGVVMWYKKDLNTHVAALPTCRNTTTELFKRLMFYKYLQAQKRKTKIWGKRQVKSCSSVKP